MLKAIFLQVLLVLLLCATCLAQSNGHMERKAALRNAKKPNDSILALLMLADGYLQEQKSEDLAIRYANLAAGVSARIKSRGGMANSLYIKGLAFMSQGKPGEALGAMRDGLTIMAERPVPFAINEVFNKYLLSPAVAGKVNNSTEARPSDDLPPLKSDSDAQRINLYAGLFSAYQAVGREMEGVPALIELMRVADRSKQYGNFAGAASAAAKVHSDRGLLREAFRFLQLELSMGERSGSKEVVADALMRLASLYNGLGDFPRSAEYHQKAIDLFHQMGDAQNEVSAQNNLGQVYVRYGDYSRAISLYKQALSTGIKLGDPEIRAASLHNLGEVFLVQGRSAEALSNFREAYRINDSTKNYKFIVQNYLSMGSFYQKKKQYDSAGWYFEAGRKLAEQNSFFDDMASAESHFGNLCISEAEEMKGDPATGMFQKAIDHLRNAEKIMAELNQPVGLQEVYADLSKAYKAKGDYRESMDYLNKANAIKDSLFSQQNAFKIARLESQASLAQKDSAITTSKAEAGALRKQRLLLYIGGGVLLAIGIAGFLIYRNQRRREARLLKAEFQEQVAKVEMQALRAQMNPHFIFNCLNSIKHYIVKSDSVNATGYLSKFSKLIRLILDNSAKQTTTLESEMQLLRLYIEMEALRYDNHFSWEAEMDEGLDPEVIQLPSMLIQPYIENAIWHGLMHQKKQGVLKLHVRKLTESLLEIIVEDNGIGRKRSAELKSSDVLAHKSHGMSITKDRLDILGSTYRTAAAVSIEDLQHDDGSAAGTRVTLHVPFQSVVPDLVS